MSVNLVIVESPAKAKTIKKYLGTDFEVLASYGHVRDLVPKEGAVDPENDFRMQYQLIETQREARAGDRARTEEGPCALSGDRPRPRGRSDRLAPARDPAASAATSMARKCTAWPSTRSRATASARRSTSHAHCRSDLVNAQQARRALDYLVGFNLSPLLWKKVRRGLSAGRVQSPALRMICEREEEIEAFKPREYWTIDAEGEHSEQQFPLKLVEFEGGKVEQFSFTNTAQAHAVEQTLKSAAAGHLKVLEIDRKPRRRNPAPPFTTSTLQQEAARKLGFSAQRTMRLAQQLYEGVDTGEGAVGLITYMRTDSAQSRERSGAGNSRDASPSSTARRRSPRSCASTRPNRRTRRKRTRRSDRPCPRCAPADIEGRMDADQHRLYALIWKRAIACQMAHALYDTVAVDMLAGSDGAARHVLRANGSTLVTPGFMAVYHEDLDDAAVEEGDRVLPAMQVGDAVKLLAIHPEQHFTEPPPRYSEASLVKALEEHGIGRPSTYASIISTLKDREYVEMDSRRFVPTDIGKIVNRFLTKNFHRYVEYGFTARMEDALDAISRGEDEWVPLMHQFWKPFIAQVQHTEKNVTREEVAQARDLGEDPTTGKPVSVRMGRFGPFVQMGTKDDEEKPRFAGLRPRPEDGSHHARRCDGAVQAAAHARADRRRRAGADERRPLRSVHQVRREIRLAQGRRSVHGRAATRARAHRAEEGGRCQPHHPRLQRCGDPGAQRPLRSVHHRQDAQRQDSERPRSQGR